MSKAMSPFRLALRVDGAMWNAYVAPLQTMEHAIWIGSIRLKLVENDPRRKEQFMGLMKDCLKDTLKEIGVEVERWNEQTAPEHERSKE
jgi:hypothetical protein